MLAGAKKKDQIKKLEPGPDSPEPNRRQSSLAAIDSISDTN
jgi:hypothetical protein